MADQNQDQGTQPQILALTGGVGGAKLVLGLARCLSPEALLAVANTADDFRHYGLHVSPDLDSVMYALAGVRDLERGWGMADESWAFMAQLAALGEPGWFNLGDRDLATHVLRTHGLESGSSLSSVTRQLCERFGVRHQLLPMSDDLVETKVHTDQGILSFQEYFVRHQCQPRAESFEFAGAESAQPNATFLSALHNENLGAVVICPSNPFVSVDPILALPGVREALYRSPAPVIAVSPIIGGKALKGPAGKMFEEQGKLPSAVSVASHYGALLDGMIIDQVDAELGDEVAALGVRVWAEPTIMQTEDDSVELARRTLRVAQELKT